MSKWLAASLVWAVWQSQAFAVEKPPALLEPYAGYDVVFGPTGPRVLGPEAGPVIDGILHKPSATLRGEAAACQVGDIRLEPQRLLVEVSCPAGKAALVLVQRDPAAAATAGAVLTDGFAVQRPEAWAAACDAPCEAQRVAVVAQVAERLRSGEAAIPWQRVRPQPGSPAGALLTALLEAHQALSIQDAGAARQAVARAKASRPLTEWQPTELFDLALLATEAKVVETAAWAREGLQTALARGASGDQAVVRQSLQLAVQALAGEATATADAALGCIQRVRCDVIPTVRALAASGHFAQAARVLDGGPLRDPQPRQDLLKLRFGLASALNDAAGELAVARRMIALDPQAPAGYDVLAAGLARAGQYREAIETLHDLATRHPERDIVLGRIAGLINFLTDAAGQDPAKKVDLDTIEARMKAAAAGTGDVVARFIVATRAYYAGRLQEALPQLEALLDSGNRDPRIPLYTAMAHFWLGHQAQAQQLIQRAVEIGPSDPDVFYCRSQIVRKVNLPLAIADLERYQKMTSQPWSVGPKQKADRVQAELDFMRRGLLPPDWDKPGPERVVFLPDSQTGTEVSDDVRLGRVWLPGAVTPGADGAAAAVTPSDLAEVQTPVQDIPPPLTGPKPPEPGIPFWPIALAGTLLAALLARYLGGKVQPGGANAS